MKVLLLSTWREPCGVAGYSGHLVAALEHAGVAVEVHPVERWTLARLTRPARRHRYDAFVTRAAAADIDVVLVQHEFGFFGESLPESLQATSRLLRALQGTGKPVFVTFHTLLTELRARVPAGVPRPSLRKRLRSRVAWWYYVARHFRRDGTLRATVHSPLASDLLQQTGIAQAQIDIIPQGVSPHAGVDRADARRALGYGDDDFVVVLTGFVAEYKGPDIALRAWTALRRTRVPRCVLAIVGGPHPEAEDTHAYARVLHLAQGRDDVRVTGYVEARELARHLAAADLAIAPYRDVGLLSSASLATALGASLPVVASAIDVFSELEARHHCLALIAPESPQALAQAIHDLATDAPARERLAAAARVYAQSHDWDSVAQMHRAVYGVALARRSGTAPVSAQRADTVHR